MSEEKKVEGKAVALPTDEQLQELLTKLGELEKSGLLDVALVAVKKMDELLQYAFQEPALYRLLAVALDGSLGAMRQVDAHDVIELKATVQGLGSCLVKDMGADDLAAAKPAGLGALLSALGDDDVKKGLGVTLAFLRSIGKCARQMEAGVKQGSKPAESPR